MSKEEYSQFYNVDFLNEKNVTIGNVVNEYFSSSPFYDPRCLNEKYKTQGKTNVLNRYSEDGISYRLIYAQPGYGEKPLEGDELDEECNQNIVLSGNGLAIINKVSRFDNKDEVLATYYFYKNYICRAPDIFSIISSHLSSSIYFFQQAIQHYHNAFSWSIQGGNENAQLEDPPEPGHVFSKRKVEYDTRLGFEQIKFQKDFLDQFFQDLKKGSN